MKRRAGDLLKRLVLREPVKPRRQQGAADENHCDVNDQRPEWSHGATIKNVVQEAKREIGRAQCLPISEPDGKRRGRVPCRCSI
jgi:hypothetical protein